MNRVVILQIAGGGDLEQFMAQPFVTSAFTMLCLFGFVLVILVGLLMYVRRRKAEQELDNLENNHGGEMPDLRALTTPLVSHTPTSPTPVHAPTIPNTVEVLRVMRDVIGGGLLVQLGGQTFAVGQANDELRGQLKKVLRELVNVANTPMGSAPAAQSHTPTAHDTTPVMLTHTTSESVVAPAHEVAPAAASTFKLPSFKLDEHPLGELKRGRKNTPKPLPEIDLAGRIEAYLQYKLANTGAFAGRSLHILPAADGSVSIEVDGRTFESVGDVDEAPVREFLSAAIQEWQAQQ